MNTIQNPSPPSPPQRPSSPLHRPGAAILSFLALLALTLAACERTPSAAPTTAPTATPTATLPAGPRIVSAVPAATLNLVLIGAADALVGVSPYDIAYLPDNKKNLPIVGDYNLKQMNLERLIALKPTALIVQTAELNIPERLRELSATHHFDIINIKLDTSADLWNTVKILGHAAGKDAAADAAIMIAQADLKALAASLAGKPRPRVVYVINKNPLEVVGAGNFMDEILTLAGADNAAAKIGTSFIPISNETLIKLAPDVLLIGAPSDPDQQPDDPRLESWQRFPIPAAKNDRIFLVTDGNALTASVDLPKNVRALSALIHKGEPAPAAASASPAPAAGGSNP